MYDCLPEMEAGCVRSLWTTILFHSRAELRFLS